MKPYIVTSWHGHRDDADIPDPVREVWRGKFNPRRRAQPEMQSNVDLTVLDSHGKVVHSFDGFRHQNFDRRETLAEYTARELERAAVELRLDEERVKPHPLKLPDLNESRGIRMFVRLMDDRMKAYQAPVVEVVPLESDDWKLLAWPEKARTVDAATLTKWLSQVDPPGVMERTNPRTKVVYKIKAVEGKLSLTPAGLNGPKRYGLLSGQIRLIDEGDDDFSFSGKLDIVLTYAPDDSSPKSLRGVFEGLYPRYDAPMRRTRWLSLQASFESRPE